ncbi:hypothetical protein AB0K51_17745 [Kitasatospora sp. NPDC049285]|uniref:hypothetical protein n=1 Tax=Kitasatospora sp. NPDC049285 TaxID=3157096 RepID=UPI003441786A
MSMEAALLESRTLRSGLCSRTEVLDEVKALVLLPDGLHVTTRMVADYFQVGDTAVYALVRRHRAELESNGYTVHKPVDNSANQTCKMQVWQVSDSEGGESPVSDRPQGGGSGIALYSRRAVLNVAMLLRDSEVARAVRSRLLDLVEAAPRPVVEVPEVRAFRARPWKRWSELRWDEYEAVSRDPAAEAWRRRIDGMDPFDLPYEPGVSCEECYEEPGEPVRVPSVDELPVVVAGLAVSVGAIERRLDAQGAVITAISERISRQGAELTSLGADVRAIRRDVAYLRGRRRRG